MVTYSDSQTTVKRNLLDKLYVLKSFFISKNVQDSKRIDCSSMKIGEFIEIVCNQKEKPSNWEDIFDEYANLIHDTTRSYTLGLFVKYDTMIYKATAVLILCDVIIDSHVCIPICDAVRAITQVKREGKMNDSEVQVHKNIANTWLVKAKEKKKDIDKLNVKTKESTRVDWYEQLRILGKHRGFRIDPEKESVLEYCLLLNAVNKEHSQLKNSKNGK